MPSLKKIFMTRLLAAGAFPENIMVDRPVKQLPNPIMIFCLSQDPHQLGDGGLQSHVIGFDKAEIV